MLPEKLSSIGQEKKLPAKTLLFQANSPAVGFYYINEGEIRLYKMDANAKEIELGRLAKGDFLGEVILFATNNYPANAETTKKSNLLYFPKQIILEKINTDPELATFFVKLMANKCFQLNQKLERLTMLNVRQRFIQYLLSLCPGNNNCIINLPLKKADIAKTIGTIPETFSRNLKQLEKEKLLKVHGNKIHILNCVALKKELT